MKSLMRFIPKQNPSRGFFTDDPITDEDKKLILTSAIQAPSAGCQLLYTILDITDQNEKRSFS